MKLTRSSVPTAIALLALFVALGGPAQAQRFVHGKLRKGSVTSRTIKDRTVRVRDIKRRAVRTLKSTANSSITEAKLANGSVTPGKIAAGAVGSAAIADRSVMGADLAPASVGASSLVDGSIGGAKIADGSLSGAKVADGSLAAQDLARFYGRFRVPIPEIPANECWSRVPTGLAPELAGADISSDLVLVTPGVDWQQDQLAFTATNDGNVSRFILAACNVTERVAPAADVGFRYMVIDLP